MWLISGQFNPWGGYPGFNTLLFLDYVHPAAGPTGCPSVQGTRGVGIQGLTLYYFLDDVQLLGLQGVQGSGGVGPGRQVTQHSIIFR